MKILAIDSSGSVASAAVLEDDRMLSECTVNYKMKHSTTLLPLINYAAELVSLDLKDVDAIAVTAGPGSFTGLRIGSATAKGLGLAMEKPIIPVPTLSAIAYGLCGTDALVCPIMDARREQVYNALYRFEGNTLTALTEQRAIYMKDVIEEVNRIAAEGGRVIFLGDGVPVYRKMIEEAVTVPFSFAPAHLSQQRAGAVGALAMIAFSALVAPLMPYLLSFAAGAMIYVVVEELVPQAAGERPGPCAALFSLGFTVMMALDVAL